MKKKKKKIKKLTNKHPHLYRRNEFKHKNDRYGKKFYTNLKAFFRTRNRLTKLIFFGPSSDKSVQIQCEDLELEKTKFSEPNQFWKIKPFYDTPAGNNHFIHKGKATMFKAR